MSAWFEESFGEDYLLVYKHRDLQGAMAEVRGMTEWLDLPQDADVFDLCCGMGRHALSLNGLGYHVTAMDLSDVLLKEARRLDIHDEVNWLKGDMRSIPLDGPFDAVVNFFTSFGYFDDDADNVKVLQEIARLLRDEGVFLIDFLNAAYVIENLVPSSERMEGDQTIAEHRRIEDGYVRKNIVITNQQGNRREYREQVKLYELPDFQRMLAAAGLTLDRVYGNYKGEPYSKTGQRLILVGHKKGVNNVEN